METWCVDCEHEKKCLLRKFILLEVIKVGEDVNEYEEEIKKFFGMSDNDDIPTVILYVEDCPKFNDGRKS